MIKRIITLLFCLFLIFASIPFLGNTYFSFGKVYAAVDDDQYYIPLRSENDLVKAFQAYCKSRDLTIEGSTADAITTFTTSTFNFFANSIGIDITQLQAEIKAQYDNAGVPVKFLFSSLGVDAMNRIFAQFLQDNELSVGDSADEINNTVYSGTYFVDADGFGCLVYKLNNNNGYQSYTYISEIGSAYKYDYTYLFNNSPITNTFNCTSSTVWTLISEVTINNEGTRIVNCRFKQGSSIVRFGGIREDRHNGRVAVSMTPDGKLRLCAVDDATQSLYNVGLISNIPDSNKENVVIFLTTNNTVINNNNYEGDTYITNEGDVINNNPPGGQNPGWDVGGGQGSYDDGQGNNYTINFPDFELPDLNIDWSIQGLGNKFPFSIPFDIANLVTVLNAEPEAPRFQGTMNFGFTTWDYDINLEQFDSVAHVCRIAELLLLVFGLIMITRSIIKG